MTHDSRTSFDSRHRRTILVATLIVIGVCLFALTVGLSFCVPMADEDESGLVE
jgi:multisubunit Na+/H+ antiporter MnhC subunit